MTSAMSEASKGTSSCPASDREPVMARNTVKSYGIAIDSSKIHEVAYEDQPETLRDLGVNVFDQEVFEEGVLQQVDNAVAELEDEYERKRLEKDLQSIEKDLRSTEHKIKQIGTSVSSNREANKLLFALEDLKEKKTSILQQLTCHSEPSVSGKVTKECCTNSEGQTPNESSAERLLSIGDHNETDTERLIRLGEMTPFGGTIVKKDSEDHAVYSEQTDFNVLGREESHLDHKGKHRKIDLVSKEHEHRHMPGVFDTMAIDDDNDDPDMIDNYNNNHDQGIDNQESGEMLEGSDGEYIPDEEELKLSWKDEDNMFISDNYVENKDIIMASDEELVSEKSERKQSKKHRRKTKTKQLKCAIKDDGDDNVYQTRIKEMKLKKIFKEKGIDYAGRSDEEDEDSWDDEVIDEEFDKGLKIPGVIWQKLFRYQKTGVKWLWELHCQQAGGIVGDEMGLGKTIQVIAFLAGLKCSKIGGQSSRQGGLGPVLIICPATVIYQWVDEFHKWWPEFRVAVLHDTGSYQGPKDRLVTQIRSTSGVLVTTYSGVRLNQEYLLPVKWDYVILDEGHIIRNPDAEITLACKQFRTAHRIVLSGSPMQNNLRELWSLFDFVFPGKLGTLPVFMQEFSVPITMGGYANASSVQVQTAYKCACVLRDTINPYLLRRLKKDVKMKLDLPNKSEQVLFCRLTDEQTEIYKEYLASREVGSILSGSMKVFPGLIMLRKICNHPDLTTEAGSLWKLRKDKEQGTKEEDSAYGHWQRSGKLIVVHSLLKLWKKQKHKVLLFSQTCQMLKILEIFVKSQGYNYLRMDGTTAISRRQTLINKFNKDKSIFVFLLTTRVGGLGVNLVGANRVVIYDPDWNPGTDMQAKERAWRVGQKRDVTIYRLLTTGTIEEKIYHRQIFKQFLTNRVLKDPKQRRFFKSNDLFELFTLDASDNKSSSTTETSAIFAGLGCEVDVPEKAPKRKALNPVKDKDVIKMMKEKTKEILKTQFSSKQSETVTETSDQNDDRKTKNIKDNCERLGTCRDGLESSDGLPVCKEKFVEQRNIVKQDSENVASSTFEFGEKSREDVSEASTSSKCVDVLTDGREIDYFDGKEYGKSVSSITKKRKLKEHEQPKGKKNKKKKRNKIEGIRIGQLSHSEPYDAKKDSEEGDHGSDDHYILRKLFKKSGVHSALQHDTIVDSGNADNYLVENEAKRVASQAAEALKRSRDHCMRHGRASGLPTWTGQSGIVGSPHGVPRRTVFGSGNKNGTSETTDTSPHFSGDSLFKAKTDADLKTATDPIPSTQLLARMRARNFTGGNNAGTVVPAGEQNHEQTIAEMRNFISTRCSLPGRATTREILTEFSSKLPVSETAVFRAMLKSICDFDRDASGEGFWVLKPDFSGAS